MKTSWDSKSLLNLINQTDGIEMLSFNDEPFLLVEGNNIWDYLESETGLSEIKICKILGCESGFDDEYTLCSECGRLLCTTPTSAWWQPDYLLTDFGHVCNDCVDSDLILDLYTNNPKGAITSHISKHIDLEGEGFTLVDGINEMGYYNSHDNPQEIMDSLHQKYEDVIFKIVEMSPFHTQWQTYVRGER